MKIKKINKDGTAILKLDGDLNFTTHRNLQQAVEELMLKMMGEREIELVVDEKIRSGDSIIRQLRESSCGRIIGLVMAEVRGKADPILVAEMVKKKVLETLSRSVSEQ